MTILWSRWLNRLKQKQGKAVARKRPRFLPRLEALEERYVPAPINPINVNTFADTVAVDPTTSPNDAGGNISLRSALQFANDVAGGGETIILPGSATQHYLLTLGALPITNSVTIEGAGAATTLIDAQQLDRVMTVASSATTVTLQGLTLENGKAPTAGGLSFGGAIEETGATNLNITNCVLTNNTAQGAAASGGSAGGAGAGGAVYQYGGTLTFTDDTVSNNTAQGGADTLGNGGGAGVGGGVFTVLGTLVVQSSTFSGNHAFGGATNSGSSQGGSGEGGAIDYTSGSGVGLTVTDSTFNGNEAVGANGGAGGNGLGGAVYDAAHASVTDSTIAGNTATGGTGGIFNGGGEGGGYFFAGGSGVTASIGGTIIAKNTASNTGQDVFTTDYINALFTSLGHNLIGIDDQTGGDGFTNGNNNDQVGGTTTATQIDPLLGPLGPNGGPTETMAIGDNSPAFGKGSVHDTAAFDQRGVSRPIGFQGDVGAYQTEEHLDGGGYTLTFELTPGNPTPATVELLVNGVVFDVRALSGLTQYHIIDTGADSSKSDFLTVDYRNGAFALPNGLTFTGDGTSQLTVNDSNAAAGQEYTLTPPTVVPLSGPIQPAQQATRAQVGRLGAPITYSGLYLLTVDTTSGSIVDVHGTANATLVNVINNAVVRVAPDSGLLGSVLNGPLVINTTGAPNTLEVSEANNSIGDSVVVSATQIVGQGPTPLTPNAAPFEIDYSGFFDLVGLTTGSGADVVNVIGTQNAAVHGQTIVSTGGGDDRIGVDAPGQLEVVLGSDLTIDGGAGNNALVVSEANAFFGDNPSVTDHTITGPDNAHPGRTNYVINYFATGGTFAGGVSLITGTGADNITVYGKRPNDLLYIDAGGGGDTVTVDVSNTSLYSGLLIDGGASNTSGDKLVVNDVSGGAAFQTLPLDATHSDERIAYSGTDVSDVVFSNFGTLLIRRS